MSSVIKLLKDSILQIPLNNYVPDFTFIINNVKFQTSKIVADLLSTQISQIHQIDPTFSQYHLTTQSKGNFQTILDLVSFEEKEIKKEEFPFVKEVLTKLKTEKFSLNTDTIDLTIDNAILMINQHESFPYFYKKNLDEEINFISTHFNEFSESQKKQIMEFSSETIECIINNNTLSLDSEDDLLSFINKLYLQNKENAHLYENVYFINISVKMMKEFISIINFDDITNKTWISLSQRFLIETEIDQSKRKYKYKIKILKEVPFLNNKNLKGIFGYFRENSNFDDEVQISFSSKGSGDPKLLTDIECTKDYFCTDNKPNSWICFEFKKHEIIPSNYSIRSNCVCNSVQNHLKNWVIEGSIDGKEWLKIDEQKDNSDLKSKNVVHTFPIKKQDQSFKFIRIFQTGPNWINQNYLELRSIEFYGKII